MKRLALSGLLTLALVSEAVAQCSGVLAGGVCAAPTTGGIARLTRTPIVGVPGTVLGTFGLAGSTSGTVTIRPQAAAGTYNFNLPTSAGTSGQPLLSGGGGAAAMTFGTLSLAHFATGTAGYALIGNGASASSYQGFTATGTGAVTRTWQAKAADVVHAFDFGVVADGVTINTTAIGNALTAACAQQKKVIFPIGTIVTAGFTIPCDISIEGGGIEGSGTDLTKLSFSSGGILTAARSIHLSNMTLTSSGTCLTIGDAGNVNYYSTVTNVRFLSCSIGLEAINASGLTVHNGKFDGFTTAGVAISSPLNPDGGDCTISDGQFLTNGGVAGGASNAAIYHSSGGGWKVLGGKMVGGNIGYWHRADYTGASSSVILDGISIEGMATAMVAFSNVSTTLGDLYNVAISNLQGGANTHGILFEANTRNWIHVVSVSNIVIRNTNGATTGMSIDGVNGLYIGGGSINNDGTGTTGVVIGSLSSGEVHLPTIANYTTRYTNASATVNVLDIKGSLTTVAAVTLPAIVQGDLWYGSAAGVISALAKDANATRYLSNTGGTNNPAWAQVNLANGVTGTLPQANGGFGTSVAAVTGVAYFTSGTASFFDPAPITASLGADVDLNNTANYFSGPAVAQGSTGTWCASGTVTVLNTAAASTFYAKLWDGTNILASGAHSTNGASFTGMMALSGCQASPAGNIRIDVRDIGSTTGKIKFNSTGNSKDSTVSAWRVK